MSSLATAGSLVSLHRYPVKSMMGEEINAAQVTPRGVYGDRAYALCDVETRKIVSAKNPRKWPNLFSYRAAYVIPPETEPSLPAVRVMLPDGRLVRSSSPEFAPTISSVLGRKVALVSAPPEGAQLEEYWPDIDGLSNRDVVTDEAVFPQLAPADKGGIDKVARAFASGIEFQDEAGDVGATQLSDSLKSAGGGWKVLR